MFSERFCTFLHEIPFAYVELTRPRDARPEYLDDMNIADLRFSEGRLLVNSHESVRTALGLLRLTLSELPRTLPFRVNFRGKNRSEALRDTNARVNFV